MAESNFFESAHFKYLLGNVNICAPHWGEKDCRYAYHKLYYFLGGKGELSLKDGFYRPEPGDLFFIPAGTLHSYGHDPAFPVQKYWCHFDMILGEGRSISFHPDAASCRPEKQECRRLFEKLLGGRDESPFLRPLAEQSSLMELMLLFLKSTDSSLLLSSHDRFGRIERFLQEHFTEDLRLDDMAEEASLHPNYFILYFKKNFGVTPVEYLQNLRLRHASLLLQRGETIQSAALQSGFKDYRYFSRLFKRKYGLTPSAYQHLRPCRNS